MQLIAEENPNLEDYPLLFIAIQEYELPPFVGRRIEKYIAKNCYVSIFVILYLHSVSVFKVTPKNHKEK